MGVFRRSVAVLSIGLLIVIPLAQSASPSVCKNHQSACLQSKGKALLQHRQGQEAGTIVADDDFESLSKTKVGDTRIHLPVHLVAWAHPAGFTQLRNMISSRKQDPDQVISSSGGLEDYISGTLLPQAVMTRKQLDEELADAISAVENCAAELSSADEEEAQEEVVLGMAEQRHGQFERLTDATHEDSLQRCEEFETYCEQLQVPEPLQNFRDRPATEVARHFEIYFNFYSQAQADYGNRKDRCIKSKGLGSTEAAKAQEDETNLEKSHCELKKKRIEICQQYSSCYTEQTELFNRKVDDVRTLEQHVKDNFRQLSCFKLDSDGTTCAPPDTTNLNVLYPKEPLKATCREEPKTTRDYSGIECPDLKTSQTEDSGDMQDDIATSTMSTSSPPPAPRPSGDVVQNVTNGSLLLQGSQNNQSHW